MKTRLIAVASGVAALGLLGAVPALATGPGSGTCTSSSLPTPPSGSTTQTLPDGGQVFAGGSTSGGAAGIEGPHGYLQASGSSSGGTISGYSTDQGNLNGSLTVGSSPSVCAGVAGTTVSAP